MNFKFSEEQQQFTDSLGRWLQRNYTFEHRREAIAQGKSNTADWNALAELGTFALTAPEEAGGFEGNAVDVIAAMEQLGANLVVEPALDAYVALDLLHTAPDASSVCGGIAAGEKRVSVAFFERESRYDATQIALSATARDGGYALRGEKVQVIHGADADMLIVAARTAGHPGDESGITLLLVPRDTEGLSFTRYPCIDGFHAADIRFDDAFVPASACLNPLNEGWPLLDRAVDLATVGVCGEALGIMKALNDATFEYVKTRQQFGVTLGSFQALQHRCVEMLMEFRQARVLTMLAATKMQADDAWERRRAVSAAKQRVNRALRFIGQNAVHLHGGIGVTDELPVAHFYKRATIISKTWGDTDHHTERYVANPLFRAPIATDNRAEARPAAMA